MASAEDIIRDAESLPVEERAIVADSILRTLNRPDPAIDSQWLAVARRRLHELRSGDVKPVPGNDVLSKVRERFEK